MGLANSIILAIVLQESLVCHIPPNVGALKKKHQQKENEKQPSIPPPPATINDDAGLA